MSSVTNEELMAYADGELTGADKARVETALETDEALRTALQRHRALRASLAAAYAPVLEEPVPERLTAAVRGAAPASGGVIDFGAARAARARPTVAETWRAREWGAMAAALVVGVLVGGQMLGGQGLVQQSRDGLVAHGALARALETQLAADTGGAVQIGVSFETADGDACRTFAAERGALQGLACKEEGAWRIDMALRAPAQADTTFRTAGAELAPALAARVEERIGDDGALDAAAERAARDAGWR